MIKRQKASMLVARSLYRGIAPVCARKKPPRRRGGEMASKAMINRGGKNNMNVFSLLEKTGREPNV